LKRGKAKLYNENGKNIKRAGVFAADFNVDSGSYRGMMDCFLIEFEGGEKVWDFDPVDFKNGRCFLGKKLKKTANNFIVQKIKEVEKKSATRSASKKKKLHVNSHVKKKYKVNPKYNDPTKYYAYTESNIKEEQYVCKAGPDYGNEFVNDCFIPYRLFKKMMPH
jgi:hypothetical protein